MSSSILLCTLGGSRGSFDFWIQVGVGQWNEAAEGGSLVGGGGELGDLLLVSLNLGHPQVAPGLLVKAISLSIGDLSGFSSVSSNSSLQTWRCCILSLVLSLSPPHTF